MRNFPQANSGSAQAPGSSPRPLSLPTSPAPHLRQAGISQLAAGCEVQLLQGPQHEQGGAPRLGRRGHLGARGLMFQLWVCLCEEVPASQVPPS